MATLNIKKAKRQGTTAESLLTKEEMASAKAAFIHLEKSKYPVKFERADDQRYDSLEQSKDPYNNLLAKDAELITDGTVKYSGYNTDGSRNFQVSGYTYIIMKDHFKDKNNKSQVYQRAVLKYGATKIYLQHLNGNITG